MGGRPEEKGNPIIGFVVLGIAGGGISYKEMVNREGKFHDQVDNVEK
jgi:hypothetical protein